MVIWLKVVHIAAITIWCGGLVALPSLFVRRPAAGDGPGLWRLQRFARAVFIEVVSPAAVVAIGSGIALVFAREVFTAWFAVKLLAVGTLVVLHLRVGIALTGVFRPGERYSALRRGLSEVAAAGIASSILWLVLAKPDLGLSALPEWMRTPGGLQSVSDRLRPMP